ncbi:TOG array regulator of axonemal microtubules protein 2 isoform X2 [Xenopus laevis]|uniref:TOG array regulator of axonemal microtubules protein 2 isoform X2 n=1 Tax=Xenopus laevis TaxID=8355 RepID=A0A8J1KMH3_XENLA|nr:TOG array regulator of axonemal microtubules protein 2 isoform X2 [Xenopus laevis]
MAHNDFTAATFRAPVAVYCGSVPKMKPGYGSMMNGSVDSNIQLCGSRWAAAETAAIQSTLSFQMKRSYLWGDEFQSQEIKPLPLEIQGRNDLLLGERKKQWEQEVDSAMLETAHLKDKLKRKLSEGPKGVPNDGANSAGPPLKPAVPRSASQRLLNATPPVPPIQRSPQRSPTPQTAAVTESSAQTYKPITDALMFPELPDGHSPASMEHLHNSLQHPRYSTDMKWTALSGIVIPPIPKSLGMVSEPMVDASSQVPRDIHDLRQSRKQESSHQSRILEERPHKPLESRSLESVPYQDQQGGLVAKDSGTYMESKAISFGRDGKQLSQSGEEWKENTGRINFTISKSAQDKMRQKQLEMENILQNKRRNQQQLWDRLQLVDPGEICLDYPSTSVSVSLNGAATIPGTSDKRRITASYSATKFVSRTSLPRIPPVNQDSSANDMRHASAYSLPAYFQDCLEWDSDSENGGQSIGPMSHPEQGLIEALRQLNNKDWEQKEKGLSSVRCLSSCHPDVLYSRLHDVSTSVTREVSNLRSKVSRYAIRTLGDLFKHLKKSMDPEVEDISRVLLHKIGDTNEFIREESEKSLGIMVENVSPSKTLPALMAGGISHRNSSVRKCSAKYLLNVMEQLGAERLLSGTRESNDTMLRTVVRLNQDRQQDTRFYGRRMFCLLMGNPKFESQMERLIPSHDLRDLIATVKQKETTDSLSQAPSAKCQRSAQKSIAVLPKESPAPEQRPREVEPEPQESPVPRRQPVRAAEVTEQLKELSKLLTAKDFQSKMDGVTLVLEYSRNNPKFVTANITQIFDSFNPRLQDANKKVNQFALESAVLMIPLLKESLQQVLVPMVTVVTDNLNCKHSGIYTAAGMVLDTLIANIDNLWLLQPFASRIRFISGRAMSDITEHLSGLVTSVYPRKPQAVERHVLPVLWYFLSNITGNGVFPGRNGNFKEVVSKLAKTLYKEMGPSLEEYTSGQPKHAIKMLADILGTQRQ